MGEQTSPADRPAPTRPRRASTVLAAISAVVTLLGATGVVLLTSRLHAAAGQQANSLFVDTLNVFDSDPTLPATQVSTATVTDKGPDVVTITDIQFSLTPPPGSGEAPVLFDASGSATPTTTTTPPPTVPFVIFPGENCKGAVLQPDQDCMVSVRYTSPGQIFHGSLIVTTADDSQAFGDTGANQAPGLDQIVADPYVVDFGTRRVGQTSPTHTITISASPDGTAFDMVAASIVDTVPTPGDRADYRITADNCTGQELQLPPPPITIDAVPAATVTPAPVSSCTIQVTDTPGGTGSRPAFLSVAFCGTAEETDSLFQAAAAAAADSGTPSGSSSPSATSTTPPPPPPQDPNIYCPNVRNFASFHQIVALDGTGQATSTPPPTFIRPTTTPPTTPPTTTPPPTTTAPPPPTRTPTLAALPPLSPADRTTAVSGTGFPVDTPVIFALVALNTPPDTNLSSVADAVTTTTDANGDFTDKVMLIMPHTAPGQYEILAQAQFGKVPVTATVPFLVAPGSQEPPKFVVRH